MVNEGDTSEIAKVEPKDKTKNVARELLGFRGTEPVPSELENLQNLLSELLQKWESLMGQEQGGEKKTKGSNIGILFDYNSSNKLLLYPVAEGKNHHDLSVKGTTTTSVTLEDYHLEVDWGSVTGKKDYLVLNFDDLRSSKDLLFNNELLFGNPLRHFI